VGGSTIRPPVHPGRRSGHPGVLQSGDAIYRLGDLQPEIHPDAFVHPDAVVIGDVSIGSEATVWPGAVLRGDFGHIAIGDRSSVQDGTVIHAGPNFPTMVGSGCVIGHLAHLEAARWRTTLSWDRDRSSCTGPWCGPEPPWAQRRGPHRMEVPPGRWPSAFPPRSAGRVGPHPHPAVGQEYVANGRRYREMLTRLD